MAVIFVLHGMGKHDKGWWGGENGTLKELKSIRRFDANRGSEATIESLVKDKKEGGDIEWIELNYDDLAEHLRNSIKEGNGFDDLIDDANERADALLTVDTANQWKADWSAAVNDINPFENHEFTAEAAWDVYLCSMKPTRHYMALHVAQQIIDFLKTPGNISKHWSMLAHSLGTALAQDVLNILFELWMSGKQELKRWRQAECVCFLANFTRTKVGDILVTRNPTSAETFVWPSQRGKNSICKYYMSARHKLDPLSYLADEMPSRWVEPPDDFSVNKYRIFERSDLNYLPSSLADDVIEFGGYIHSVENYFANPLIHLAFLARALRTKKIYQNSGGSFNSRQKYRDSAEKLFLETRKPSVANISQLVIDNRINNAKDWSTAVGSLWDLYIGDRA